MQVTFTSDRKAIRHIDYAYTPTRFGEMLTAWCIDEGACEKTQGDNQSRAQGDNQDKAHEKLLCFASFTPHSGRERTLRELRELFPAATLKLIESQENVIDFPPQRILLAGTPFRLDVWRALLTVERGRTITYAALAALAGHPTAVRAVATSVGCNPISVVVPCHRIVPASGGVGNYHTGADIKEALLEWECALP